MDVTIKQQPELRIAGVRHIGPYAEIGQTFRRLGGMLKGAPPAGAHTPDGLIEQRIPAGRYALTIHTGSYEGLPAVWNALKSDWLPKSGHRMGRPSYEVYLNSPMTTPQSELLTEIYLRLE